MNYSHDWIVSVNAVINTGVLFFIFWYCLLTQKTRDKILKFIS